jgi:hypothetical protein
MAGECLTLMVPYADLANHSFDNNSTFCMGRDTKRCVVLLLHMQPYVSSSLCMPRMLCMQHFHSFVHEPAKRSCTRMPVCALQRCSNRVGRCALLTTEG